MKMQGGYCPPITERWAVSTRQESSMINRRLQIVEHRRQMTRGWFLGQCGVGLGAIALGEMLGRTSQAAVASEPLAPKVPPLPAKAKRVIYLFMGGAPSQLELFDNKP